jgi:hypothetical protein
MPFGSFQIYPRTETNVSICGNKQGSKMGSWRPPELKLEESVMVVTESRLLRFSASHPRDSSLRHRLIAGPGRWRCRCVVGRCCGAAWWSCP